MPRDTFERAVGRMLRGPIGSTATLTTYTDDGTTDEHGDPTKQVAATVSDVPALFRQPQEDVNHGHEAGIDTSVDAEVWLPSDQTVVAAQDGNRYATRITDDATGKEYDVTEVWDEKNGTYRCAVVEV